MKRRSAFAFVFAAGISAGALLLSGCFGGTTDLVEPGLQTGLADRRPDSQEPQEEDLDDSWYNTPGVRSVFGDFGKTESVFVASPAVAAALIPRGAYLVKSAAACGACHGTTSGDPASPLAGGRTMKDRFGSVKAANITPDPETGIGEWNVFEVMRAIRAGIDRRGRPLSLDLHSEYRWLSDQDTKAIAVYLFSLDPVRNPIERRRLGGFERNKWGLFPQHREITGYVPAPQEGTSYQFGRYLANHVSRCVACHTAEGNTSVGTPFAGFGRRGGLLGLFRSIEALFNPPDEVLGDRISPLLSDEGRREVQERDDALAGTPEEQERETEEIYSEALETGNFPVLGPDIRGTSETGLLAWSEDDIVRYLSTGFGPDGELREKRFCPWPFFASMKPEAKSAIAAYLKHL